MRIQSAEVWKALISISVAFISTFVVIGLYFVVLFLISCRDEVLRIQELTLFYNRCPQDEFDRKLAEILIQLNIIDPYNYYYENNDHLVYVALKYYPMHSELRDLCYRTGLKPRLEKNMSIL